MLIRPLRLWLSLLAMVFAVGCVRVEDDGDRPRPGDTQVLISGQYQKRILGPGGWSGTENRPARYCFAEVRKDSDDTLLAYGYLDGNGQGTVSLTGGTQAYVVLYARVKVPGAKAAGKFRGSVKSGKPLTAYSSASAFRDLPDVLVPGATFTVGQGSGVTLTVPTSSWEAGAFNITDQMVVFAQGMDYLEPDVKLPALHAFWSTDHRYTDYPTLVRDGGLNLLPTNDPASLQDASFSDLRTTFQFPVRRALAGGPDSGADAFNDSVIQQSICHLLVQDYSYSSNGASLIRRDNDDAYLARTVESEPAVAFVSGFLDYLSCAFRRSNSLQDIDEVGTVRTYYLDRQGQFPMLPWRGEFYSGAIANSLYGIWKNVLGGADPGMGTLYDAAAFAKGPGEYNNSILAAYPSYLMGLKAIPGVSWTGVLGELGRENITDLTTASYLTSGTLWTPVSVPFLGSGSVGLEAPSYTYDWIAQRTYRFVLSGTATRRITLTYPGGRDMVAELYDTQGWVAMSSTAAGATSRTIEKSLPPGEYLLRVRAGYHNNSSGTWTYSLAIQ